MHKRECRPTFAFASREVEFAGVNVSVSSDGKTFQKRDYLLDVGFSLTATEGTTGPNSGEAGPVFLIRALPYLQYLA
jgi:hypothetical protein